MGNKKEWTVIFLAKSIPTGDMSYLIHLLKEIAHIDFGSQVDVFFAINFDRTYLEALMTLDEELLNRRAEGDYTTIFFRLENDQNQGKNKLVQTDEQVNFDITNGTDIELYLKEIVLKVNKSKKHMLFTWDHGNGFGIFKGVGKGGLTDPKKEAKRVLSMDELGHALSRTFGNEKVELMVMMNCFMQLFDTSYALKRNVSGLVAPQTDLTFYEYDYKTFFETLVKNPNTDGLSLGKKLIEKFDDKKSKILNKLSVSFIDLSIVDSIVMLLDELADRLLTHIKEGQWRPVEMSFKNAAMVDKSRMIIDFRSLIEELKKHLNKEDETLNKLLLAFDQMIIHSFTNIKVNNENNYHHGISMMTPFAFDLEEENSIDWTSIKFNVSRPCENPEDTDFRLKTKWGQLMIALDV
ncbi:clostripain-related cysteine peptidase [Reichenbachiella sp.]